MLKNKIIRESTIEAKVVKYAQSKGWKVYKFVSPGNRAVPDRIFIKQGLVGMIEFKAPGKIPTKLQQKVIRELQSEKIPVSIVDSVELGKEVINFWDQLENA